MMKVTFNVVRDVTVNMKDKWYKRAQPVTLQHKDQITLGGLTEQESTMCQNEFVQKIVGLFTGGQVASVKTEEDDKDQA